MYMYALEGTDCNLYVQTLQGSYFVLHKQALLVTSQTFIENVYYLAGSLFYYA